MLRLKELRKQSKISQQTLAKHLGVTQATLSGWENEKYEIDNKSLVSCADFFHVSVDFLLGKETVPSWLKGAIDEETAKANETLADIVLDLNSNPVLLDVTNNLRSLSDEQLRAVKMFLSAFQQQQINEVKE